MVFVGREIAQQRRNTIEVIDDHIEFAVVEQIAYRQAPANIGLGERRSLDSGDQFEPLAADVMKKQGTLGITRPPRLLVDDWVDMAVGNNQVLPAIVVIIEKSSAPAEEWNCRFGYPHLITDVCKVGVTIVAIKRVVIVGESGVVEIGEAVVLIVANRDAHGGGFTSAFVEGKTGGIADVFKCAVTLVEIEVIWGGVIAYQQVGQAVTVETYKDRSKSVVTVVVSDARPFTYIRKCSIAVVMEEVIRLALEAARPAHYVFAAKLAETISNALVAGGRGIGQVIVNVAGNKKVKAAIAVIVSPCGAGGPVTESDSGLFRYIGEGAVVVIVVKAILAEVSYIDIRPAIVVIVCNGDANAPSIIGDAGLVGHIGKGAVMIVVEERGPERCCLAAFGVIS